MTTAGGALLQRVGTRLGGLRVLLGRHTGDADPADDLAVDDDRDPAFERARAAEPQETEVSAALSDEILEDLGWPPEEDGRVRLLTRDVDTAELRAVEPVQGHQVAARIEDGDGDVPLVLRRLGLGARHRLLGLLERDRRSLADRGPRRRHRRLRADGHDSQEPQGQHQRECSHPSHSASLSVATHGSHIRAANLTTLGSAAQFPLGVLGMLLREVPPGNPNARAASRHDILAPTDAPSFGISTGSWRRSPRGSRPSGAARRRAPLDYSPLRAPEIG